MQYYIPDMNVTVYEDLYYPYVENIDYEVYGLDEENYDLTFEVSMGKAAAFTAFDPTTDTFEVSSYRLNQGYNGRY